MEAEEPITKEPTPRQQQYLDHLHNFWAINGYPPSIYELARQMHVYPNAAHEAIERLKFEGWVKTAPHGPLRPVPTEIYQLLMERLAVRTYEQ